MRRRSIDIGDFGHVSPIPVASRIGNILASGFIRGSDPETGKFPGTIEAQCTLMFAHMKKVVEAGGATLDDVVKVSIWVKSLDRKPINEEWVKYFPDAASRPARQVIEMPMEPGVLIQCDILAVIAAG